MDKFCIYGQYIVYISYMYNSIFKRIKVDRIDRANGDLTMVKIL